MKIVLFANSRSGSTYFANGLKKCMLNEIGSCAIELDPNPFSTFHQQQNWILRLFPRHVNSFIENVHSLIPKDCIKIFLYRNDIEDALLSKLIMDITKTANVKQTKHIPKIKDLYYDPGSHRYLITQRIRDSVWYKQQIYPLYDWDHVIEYENLKSPSNDFKFLFEHVPDLMEIKLHTKKQKRDAFSNYDYFIDHFKQELGYEKASPYFMEN